MIARERSSRLTPEQAGEKLKTSSTNSLEVKVDGNTLKVDV